MFISAKTATLRNFCYAKKQSILHVQNTNESIKGVICYLFQDFHKISIKISLGTTSKVK